ncbi:MFS transporter [Flavobacterium hercynium]|uniref:MFS transporter n=1 Tax=Flavobacterium hercynium TaxID=387094 RepID=UPI000B5B7E17|nr:MFS transporter [Flavobacterium hercynium]SMP20447.1 Predicted arabinose efflux permease, MFS family [Flavobacterium hercynium]
MQIISNKKLKKENQKIATLISFALIPLSGFATDIYLPSMPSMGTALHISSLEIQLTLSIFLISYGVAQLFIGSIVDSFGRYNISLTAMVLFILSCLVIANTQNIYLIYTMRLIHGITVAGIVVAKRAYFVDLFEGEQLKIYLSIFTIIWSTGPIIAPFIGGYLQEIFGWEANFYFLGAVAAVFFVLEMVFGGETIKAPMEFNIKKIGGIYLEMLKTPSFMLGVFMLGLAYSMVMVYNMSGPFIIEHELLLTPVVAGYCSLILGFAWMAGGFIGKATIKIPFYKKMAINILMQIIFVVAMILAVGFYSSVFTLVLFAFLIHVCSGYTYNNYFVFSLSSFPKNAGIAGGLTGGIVYILVSFLSFFIIKFLPAKDQYNLSYSYLILALLSGLVMFIIVRYVKNITQK